jgi:Type I restriction enzyme R protein N terminus (HSDR_N)
MIPLSFPEPDFKVKNSGRGPEIWDRFRKKWVMLQPEEWVRQNVLNWLVKVHQIPESLISVEKGLPGASKKRYDILVFNQSHQPWMMVECKSTETILDESVLMQILSYHSSVQVNYIVITNGHQCHIAELKKANQIWLASFPIFEQ